LVVQSKVKKSKWLDGCNGLMVVNANIYSYSKKRAFFDFHPSNDQTTEPRPNHILLGGARCYK